MGNDLSQRLKVFISYASEDRALVLPYWDKLKRAGFQPWIDCKNILPGREWQHEIQRAFSSAHVYILFISPRSVSKRGFVQREARDAIEKLRYAIEGDITVIPVILESCEIPGSITEKLQYVHLNEPTAWGNVISALSEAARQREMSIQIGHEYGPFRVFIERFQEVVSGNPGHKIEIEYPRFESDSLGQAAEELSRIFCGNAYSNLSRFRETPGKREKGRYLTADSEYAESVDIILANEAVLSAVITFDGYTSGAAHGFHGRAPQNFLVGDRVSRFNLDDLFIKPWEAVHRVAALCQAALAEELLIRTGRRADEADKESFAAGAGPSWTHFECFNVDSDAIVIFFHEYQVACYALGSWVVRIPFKDVEGLLKTSIVDSVRKSAND